MADTFDFSTDKRVEKVAMLLPAVQSARESYASRTSKESAGEASQDSFDFTAKPPGGANVPVDLELVLLNDVSGNVAETKHDLNAAGLKTEDGSGTALEVHINATWTASDAVGEHSYDEFGTYSNSTSDTMQDEWLSMG